MLMVPHLLLVATLVGRHNGRRQMIGKTISRYRIEEKIGEGGMGVVYRARDLDLDRHVAVKVLSADLADEDRRRRFQQEAQTASSLNHPHILTVFEAGTFERSAYAGRRARCARHGVLVAGRPLDSGKLPTRVKATVCSRFRSTEVLQFARGQACVQPRVVA